MARSAKCDQIFGTVCSEVASELNVMYLKIAFASALLTLPSVSF